MNSDTLLGLAVLVCLFGLLTRMSGWFTQKVEPTSQPISPVTRVFSAIGSVFSTFFSWKIFPLARSFVVDFLLQKRLGASNLNRWVGHTLIAGGFIALLLMHGLGYSVSDTLFSYYYPTLNPFLFLRNIFGVLVLVGVGMAVYRRIKLKKQRLHTHWSDWLALALVGTIMLSGLLLEGAKMSSYTVYQEMVEEYGATSDELDEQALQAYWVKENGLYVPHNVKPVDAKMLEYGKEVSGYSCIDCHASNKAGFVSYGIAATGGSLFALIGDEAIVSLFKVIHVLSFALLIAWLPFSKMFHVIAVPLNLLINGVTVGKEGNSENSLTKQAIGLSACTHCGACTVECSSSMYFESYQNAFILPSEKVQLLQKVAAGKKIEQSTLTHLQEGLYICTSCDRCTEVCPSGINLRDLFVNARYQLLERGNAELTMRSHFSFPLTFSQQFKGSHLHALRAVEKLFKDSFTKLTDLAVPMTLQKQSGMKNMSYQSCYSCQKCTNICPIVRRYDNPAEVLDLLPHQIIFTLGTGNLEVAKGAKMLWSCSTCYLCQEHCPNGVELCDIFYNLKNKAIDQVGAGGKA